MLDSIFQSLISPILSFLASHYGPVGLALGYLFLFVLPLCSILIELLEAVAKFTATPADDAKAAEIRAKYDKLVKALEFLPHVNVPLAPVFVKILEWASKLLAVIKGLAGG